MSDQGDQIKRQQKLMEFNQNMEQRQEQAEVVARKSFILRKHSQQESGEESDILDRLRKLKQNEQEQIVLSGKDVFNQNYWQVYMKQNCELVSWMLMNFTANLILYPLDSLKTRVQARNRFQDICHFSKNKVDQLGMYPGLTHRLALVLLGDFSRNLTMKMRDALMIENETFQNMNLISRQLSYSFLQEGLVSMLFLPIEIRKMQLQLGQRQLSTKLVASSYMHLLLPVIIRDSLFYFLNNVGYNLVRYQNLYLNALFSNQEFVTPMVQYQDRNERYSSMVFSLIVSLIITNPIDVIVTKIATQRDILYTNPLQCFRLIRAQESVGKLLFSGISSRLGFYLIKGTLFFSYMGPVQDLARSAFQQ